MFSSLDVFMMGEDVSLIASIPSGMYIHSDDNTWYMEGDSPESLTQVKGGKGAIKGTLTYAHYPNLAPYPIPIWMSKYGICAGVDGKITELTRGKIRSNMTGQGSGVSVSRYGEQFTILTAKQNSVTNAAFGDSATVEVVRKGKIFDGLYPDQTHDGVRITDGAMVE